MAISQQQKLKKKLDKIFSQFIRLRDNVDGHCKCITCGKIGYWEKDGMQCGHYISRRMLITRFDENNTSSQCKNCNLWREKNEMQISYRENLCEKIGEDKVKELEQKRHQIFKVEENWYREKIEHYQKEVDKMLKKL